MSLPYRQQHLLRQISRTLHASDPHLSAMLAIFAALTADERMPTRERIRHRLPRPVRALACAAWAAVCLIGRAIMACGRTVRHAAGRGFAACRSAVGGSRRSAPHPPARHRESS